MSQQIPDAHTLEIASLEGVINDLKAENQKLRQELETYRRDGGHVIDLREDGWTIQHPLSCRPNLFDCIYNMAAATLVSAGPRPGRYRVTVEDGHLHLGERVA